MLNEPIVSFAFSGRPVFSVHGVRRPKKLDSRSHQKQKS